MIERFLAAVVYLLVPVVGIAFFDWDWRSVVVLYWLQNITAGVRTELDMARTKTPPAPGFQASRLPGFQGIIVFNGRPAAQRTQKPFTMMFFAVHYGIFTLVHGIFVMLIVYGAFTSLLGGPATTGPQGAFDLRGIVIFWALASVIQLTVHSFTPSASLPPVMSLFWAPYPRIFVLHLTILLGVWLINYFGWPPAAALLLVALQFIVDLAQLLFAKRSSNPQRPSSPVLT